MLRVLDLSRCAQAPNRASLTGTTLVGVWINPDLALTKPELFDSEGDP